MQEGKTQTNNKEKERGLSLPLFDLNSVCSPGTTFSWRIQDQSSFPFHRQNHTSGMEQNGRIGT